MFSRLGEIVEAARLVYGHTTVEAAEAMGIAPSQFYRLRTHVYGRMITTALAARVARYVQASVAQVKIWSRWSEGAEEHSRYEVLRPGRVVEPVGYPYVMRSGVVYGERVEPDGTCEQCRYRARCKRDVLRGGAAWCECVLEFEVLSRDEARIVAKNMGVRAVNAK